MNSFDIPVLLLYYRGWLYLFVAALLLVFTFARFDRMVFWHRATLLVLATYFFCLALGGISSMFRQPEIGQVFITYGSTLLVTVFALCLSYYMIYRR